MPRGFSKGIRVKLLQQSCDCVPADPGVYVVIRKSRTKPRFLNSSTGGHFKGRDPTVPMDTLKQKWVATANVLYIGKAGGRGQRASLRSRIRAFMQFGKGKRRPKWGGRYIWQLADSRDLLVCWKVVSGDRVPADVERELLDGFKIHYGVLPFANLRR